jgi:hypothetical protein
MSSGDQALGYAYNSTGEDYYYYYAKGIGIIYMITFNFGIRSWNGDQKLGR